MLNIKNSLTLGFTLVVTAALATPIKAETKDSLGLDTQAQQQISTLEKATRTNVCFTIPIKRLICF
jgi:hypothetical protein